MKEKIQMTEDQARGIFRDCVYSLKDITIVNFMNSMRERGYIKPDPIEETKEIYRQWVQGNQHHNLFPDEYLINSLYSCLEILEEKLHKEIEYLEENK